MKKSFCGLALLVCAVFSQNASAQTRIVDLDGKGIPSVKVTARYTCPGMPGTGGGVTYEESGFTDEEGQVNLVVGPPCPPPPISYAISKSGFRFTVSSVSFTLPPIIVGTDLPEIISVSAASYKRSVLLTPGMIVAAFGENLAVNIAQASSTPLPKALADRQVVVRDNTGTERKAELFFVSPSQINYVMPVDVALGPVVIKLTDSTGTVAAQFAELRSVIPGIFSANGDGKGVVAAVVVRVRPDNSQFYEAAAKYDEGEKKFVPVPIDLSAETDRIFLGIFGTGFRGSSLSDVKVTIGGTEAAVTYIGPQLTFPGLDQINVEVPRSLIEAGEVEIAVIVQGLPANITRVAFK